jgi:hypothetical protein
VKAIEINKKNPMIMSNGSSADMSLSEEIEVKPLKCNSKRDYDSTNFYMNTEVMLGIST